MRKPLSKLWHGIITWVMIWTIIPILNGCGQSSDPSAPIRKLYKPSPDTDVTLSPYYNFSSFSGTIWKTKVKTAVADLKRYTGAHDITLLTPNAFDSTDPKYNPAHDMQIVTVLPIGTRLRIERLMHDNGAAGFVMVTATLLDGTNTQRNVFIEPTFLAKNEFVWAGWSSSTNWGVDADVLEKP
jgi:hypothetical protein